MKQIWSHFSELQNPESTRWVFLADSPRNVNRSTDERIGDDMAEKVEARMLAGESLSALRSAISSSLTVKTHFGSNLRLRDSSGKIVGRVKNGDSVTFLGETKLTTDSHGQSRDTDRDGSLTNRHLWFKVRTASGATGWLSAEYLQGSLTPPKPDPEPEPCPPPPPEHCPPPETITDPPPEVITDPPPEDPKPEPLPDTVDFSRLPGALEQAIRRGETPVVRPRVPRVEPVAEGTEGPARAEAIADDFEGKFDDNVINRVSELANVTPDETRRILDTLDLRPNSSEAEIIAALQKLEGSADDAKAASVIEALTRIPEASAILSMLRNPNVLGFMRTSAVFGTVAIHFTRWWSRLGESPAEATFDNGKVTFNNSAVDIGKYMIPVAGNFFDFGEAWHEAGKGNIGMATLNVATGIAGLVLDVFSIVTAPTGVGPAAGQSAKLGLRTAVQSLKVAIRSGAIEQGFKRFTAKASELVVQPAAKFFTENKVGRAIAAPGRWIVSGSQKAANFIGKWRNKAFSLPGLRHLDQASAAVTRSADNSLAYAKNLNNPILKRYGSYLAYGAKETIGTIYNVLTANYFRNAGALNTATDAARGIVPGKQEGVDTGRVEINGNNYNVGDRIHIKNEVQARKGVERSDLVEIKEIRQTPEGETIIKAENLETGRISEYKLSNLSDASKYTITKESPSEIIREQIKDVPERVTKIVKSISETVTAAKTKIAEAYKGLIEKFPKKQETLESLKAEEEQAFNDLQARADNLSTEIKDLHEKLTKPDKWFGDWRNQRLSKEIAAKEAELKKIEDEELDSLVKAYDERRTKLEEDLTTEKAEADKSEPEADKSDPEDVEAAKDRTDPEPEADKAEADKIDPEKDPLDGEIIPPERDSLEPPKADPETIDVDANPGKTGGEEIPPGKFEADPEGPKTDEGPEATARSGNIQAQDVPYSRLAKQEYQAGSEARITNKYNEPVFEIKPLDDGFEITSYKNGRREKSETITSRAIISNSLRSFDNGGNKRIEVKFRKDGSYSVEKIESENIATRTEEVKATETKPEAKPSKPRRKREIPDELDTKLPSAIFSNRGGVGHLRTSRLEVGKTKTVNRTRDQAIQLQTSSDKSAKIQLVSRENGMEVKYLRGYKGEETITNIPEGPGARFKVDDNTVIHIKVHLTAQGQKIEITREEA